MLRLVLTGARAPAALALAAALLAAGGCAKKVTSVDPDAFPEGVPSTSRLVLYSDAPLHVTTYVDTFPSGYSSLDRVIGVEDVYTTGPGTVQGLIIDDTRANAFQVYRRESNGGFRPLKDFVLRPVKLLLDGQADLTRFVDPAPVASAFREYVGRGVVDGVASKDAPLTNVATLTLGEVDRSLRVTSFTTTTSTTDTTRALPSFAWTSATGAVGYWVQLFQPTEQSVSGIRSIGLPAPLFTGRGRNYVVAYVPAPATSFSSLTPGASGARVLVNREIIYNQNYLVRVTAVDAEGQFLSYTGYEDPNDPTTGFTLEREELTYRLIPYGAAFFFAPAPAPPPDN